jgi:hypothetical protein
MRYTSIFGMTIPMGTFSTSTITAWTLKMSSGCWERRLARGRAKPAATRLLGLFDVTGYTPDGTYIIVIYQEIDADTFARSDGL